MSRSDFPVNNIAELAGVLGMSEYSLWRIAKTTETSYSRWEEPKTSGGFRKLSSPIPQLKKIHQKLHELIFAKVELGPFTYCGIKRKSNIANAYVHRGCDVIFTFDLKSFFPSVRPERVKRALVDELGCNPSLAVLITKLVTVNYQLPQGAPTSTDIANIVTLRLQRRLVHLAKQWGIKKFTIYSDDITFSGGIIPEGFEKMVARVVKSDGYRIHPEKGGVFNRSKSQVVTGINIAHGPTVGKKKKIWRAEHHNNTMLLQKGEISEKEFASSEKRYGSRLVYANAVRTFRI